MSSSLPFTFLLVGNASNIPYLYYRLKRQKTIPEKDARAIFMQIMSGLRYLNRPLSYGLSNTSDDDLNGGMNNGGSSGNNGAKYSGKKISIIHFDLKPGTIIFSNFSSFAWRLH